MRSLNLARSPDVPSTTFPQGLGEVEADILTGSQPDGSAFQPDKDMTCKNWMRAGYEIRFREQMLHFDLAR